MSFSVLVYCGTDENSSSKFQINYLSAGSANFSQSSPFLYFRRSLLSTFKQLPCQRVGTLSGSVQTTRTQSWRLLPNDYHWHVNLLQYAITAPGKLLLDRDGSKYKTQLASIGSPHSAVYRNSDFDAISTDQRRRHHKQTPELVFGPANFRARQRNSIYRY